MLNPFPILFLAPLGYFVLRTLVGLTLIFLATRHYQHRKAIAPQFRIWWWRWGMIAAWVLILFELVMGLMLLIGLYTQIAALLLILTSLKMLILRSRFTDRTLPGRLVYTLYLAAGLCLLVTGAGAFAFDLPI